MLEHNNSADPRRRKDLFPPLLATLISDRRAARALSGAAVVIVLLQLIGIHGWHCPFDAALGRPCPGCGLTRALVLLLDGQWQAGLQTHPWAPLAAAALCLLAISSVLPAPLCRCIAARIARFEVRTGFSVLVAAALIGHWFGRLGGLW